MSSSVIAPRSLVRLLLLLVIGVAVVSCATQARRTEPPAATPSQTESPDTVVADLSADTTRLLDTLATPQDSLVAASDSLAAKADTTLAPAATDTLAKDAEAPIAERDSVELFKLEAPVTFSAEDSIVMTGRNVMYFFGPSEVKYQRMSIEANYLKIVSDSSEVYAQYVLDSLGQPTAKPKFADGVLREYDEATAVILDRIGRAVVGIVS